jgi:hypothetical protein
MTKACFDKAFVKSKIKPLSEDQSQMRDIKQELDVLNISHADSMNET